MRSEKQQCRQARTRYHEGSSPHSDALHSASPGSTGKVNPDAKTHGRVARAPIKSDIAKRVGRARRPRGGVRGGAASAVTSAAVERRCQPLRVQRRSDTMV